MSDKLKIVLLGPSHPYRGGIASFSDRLAIDLDRAGHAVELITFTVQYPTIFFPGTTQFASESCPHSLSVKRMVNSINPISWITTGRYIRKQQVDLIIVRYWIPFLAPALGSILRMAKRKSATKVICIADNIQPHEPRLGDRMLTRYFNGAVDAYLVMSQAVKKSIDQLGFTQPVVLQPHPVFDHFGTVLSPDAARAQLGIPASSRVVLFFGLIRAYKGLDWLMEAMKHDFFRVNNVHLLVAGECYEDSDKYRSLVRSYGMGDRVHFSDGFIPDDKVNLYFSAADVLVQPYRSATQSGVTPLAMHFETPMIVTDVGGLKESVIPEKTGLVVAPDPEAIAKGIERFFELSGSIDFKQQIREEKKRYNWEYFSDQILKLFKQVSMKTLTLFIVLLFSYLTHFGQSPITFQDQQLLKKKEDSLLELGTRMIQSEDVATRFRSDSAFTRILVRALRTRNSFYHPFESLSTISRLYAPDSSFRIFTWQVSRDEDTHRRHGAIQLRTSDGSLRLFPLIDRSIVIENQQDTITNNEWWIGAIYYGVVQKTFNGKQVYTLLGYDEYSIRSTRKIIEVLSFENGKPVFGGSFFSFKNDSSAQPDQSRFWIEYKKNGNGRILYDADLDMIIYDHLISETNEPAKKYTYIPDGDYDGFRWVNGKWMHVSKVFDQKLEDGKAPVEKPMMEKKLPTKKSGG